MPRARSQKNTAGVPTAAEFAELKASLAETLQSARVTALPPAEWAELTWTVLQAGRTLVVSPQMEGRAVRLSVPVGTDRLAVTASTDGELLEAMRKLILLVRKLPSVG